MRVHPWPMMFAALLLMAAGAPAGSEAAPADGAPVDHPRLEGGVAVDGLSLYQLPMTMVDQDGATLSLDHFRGQPVIISLFYASCPSACPLLIHDIQGIEAQLEPAIRAQLRVLLVSIDPERDTPAALKAAAIRFSVDGKRWHLARAEDAQVRDLAAVLGIKYQRTSDGTLGHTSRLTLLDAEGVPRARQDGLGQPADALIAEIVRQLAPPAKEAP